LSNWSCLHLGLNKRKHIAIENKRTDTTCSSSYWSSMFFCKRESQLSKYFQTPFSGPAQHVISRVALSKHTAFALPCKMHPKSSSFFTASINLYLGWSSPQVGCLVNRLYSLSWEIWILHKNDTDGFCLYFYIQFFFLLLLNMNEREKRKGLLWNDIYFGPHSPTL
jgi:hypothetical protein